MSWPTAVAIIGCAIAAVLGVLKIVHMIWGAAIRQNCLDRFREITDTGELRREDCMERFKKMADQIQASLNTTAILQIDMRAVQTEIEGMNKKIDELKEDFRDLGKYIRDNIKRK